MHIPSFTILVGVVATGGKLAFSSFFMTGGMTGTAAGGGVGPAAGVGGGTPLLEVMTVDVGWSFGDDTGGSCLTGGTTGGGGGAGAGTECCGGWGLEGWIVASAACVVRTLVGTAATVTGGGGGTTAADAVGGAEVVDIADGCGGAFGVTGVLVSGVAITVGAGDATCEIGSFFIITFVAASEKINIEYINTE